VPPESVDTELLQDAARREYTNAHQQKRVQSVPEVTEVTEATD
jgi:hypothetical protein